MTKNINTCGFEVLTPQLKEMFINNFDLDIYPKFIAYEIFVEVFFREDYKFLKDKITTNPKTFVIDIGSFVGESAVYFLSNKAEFVYCFERNQTNINMFNANIKDTNYFNKIKLFQVDLENPEVLNNLFETFDINNKYLIKSDIEGGEYDVFTSNINLEKINAIQIEYHPPLNKLAGLIEILKNKGFICIVEQNSLNENLGFIYASRR